MSDNLAFPIPNSVLEPYIKQAVSTAICASLGDGVDLVKAAVTSALSVKCDSTGKISGYSSDNRYLLVELLARNKIAEIAREIINEMAEKMRPKIKKQIEDQLKASHPQIAEALVNGMIDSLASKWSVNVKFHGE